VELLGGVVVVVVVVVILSREKKNIYILTAGTNMESNHKKRNKTREGNGTIHRIIKIERGDDTSYIKKKVFHI